MYMNKNLIMATLYWSSLELYFKPKIELHVQLHVRTFRTVMQYEIPVFRICHLRYQ